jgi:hypothetical protein
MKNKDKKLILFKKNPKLITKYHDSAKHLETRVLDTMPPDIGYLKISISVYSSLPRSYSPHPPTFKSIGDWD